MGPTDEDPGYYAGCKSLVAEMGLSDTVRFTGELRPPCGGIRSVIDRNSSG